MKKIVLITLFLMTSLYARENPFSPQTMVVQPKMTLPPKQVIQKPIEIKTIKREEPKKLPMKIPEKKIQKSIPIVVKKQVIKHKKKKVKKKRITKSKLIYNGKFTKIKLASNSIKILTKDNMLQHIKLKHPNRLAIDFERFDVISPFSKKLYYKKVKALKIGHHDYFYRTTFKLAKNYRYKIVKKPYGYLVKIY